MRTMLLVLVVALAAAATPAAAQIRTIGSPALSRGPDGTVAVAHTATGDAIEVQVRPAGGAWTSTRLEEVGRVEQQVVTIAPDGAVRVTWRGAAVDATRVEPRSAKVVQSQVRRMDGTLGPREIVDAGEDPQLSASRDGHVVAAWHGGAAAAGPDVALHALAGAVPCKPAVATAAGGIAVAVGRRCDGTGYEVLSRPPGGDFGPAAVLATGPPNARSGTVAAAVAPDWSATVAVAEGSTLTAFQRPTGGVAFGGPVPVATATSFSALRLAGAAEGGALATWFGSGQFMQARIPARGTPAAARLAGAVTALDADAEGRVVGGDDRTFVGGTVAEGFGPTGTVPDADALNVAFLAGPVPAAAWVKPVTPASPEQLRFTDALGSVAPAETLATGYALPPVRPRPPRRLRIPPGNLRYAEGVLRVPIDCRGRECAGRVAVGGRTKRFRLAQDTGRWVEVRLRRVPSRLTVTLRGHGRTQRVRRLVQRRLRGCDVVPWARVAARSGPTRIFVARTYDEDPSAFTDYGIDSTVVACRKGRGRTVTSFYDDGLTVGDVSLPAAGRDWAAAVLRDAGSSRDPIDRFYLIRVDLRSGRRYVRDAGYGLGPGSWEPQRLLLADDGAAVVVDQVGGRVRIYVVDGRARMLDAEPGIDPESVRVSGNAVTWTRAEESLAAVV